jgi:hypothetical protein
MSQATAVRRSALALGQTRDLFYQDVVNRKGVTRAEADDILAVLDQLLAWNPERLVHIPHDPEADKKAVVIKFGLEGSGKVFWAAHPWAEVGAKLIVFPKPIDAPEEVRSATLAGFKSLDRSGRRRPAKEETVPTVDFRVLRFPRDFERATQLMADALAALT